jgi:hypothetical protein
VDSNIDWGQDVKKLGLWLDTHVGKRRARVFYFGNTQLRYYGIDDGGYPEPINKAGTILTITAWPTSLRSKVCTCR